MSDSKSIFKTVPIIGILGVVSGVVLMFTDSWFIGVSGSIASAGLVYMHFQNDKNSENRK